MLASICGDGASLFLSSETQSHESLSNCFASPGAVATIMTAPKSKTGPKVFHMSGNGNLLPKCMFSGVHLDIEVFQDTWHSNKDNPSVYWNATLSCDLSCPLMASNDAPLYLVPISFFFKTQDNQSQGNLRVLLHLGRI